MERIVVTSTILTPLFRIRSLILLDMTGNQIPSQLSGEMGSLQNLRVLKLEENSLGENIPKEIGNMTKLRQFESS
nr:leucine-rich repeat receptor-like serine/threonine-protein kinase [Quercus suber]